MLLLIPAVLMALIVGGLRADMAVTARQRRWIASDCLSPAAGDVHPNVDVDETLPGAVNARVR